ncbi:MAG: hypothetical protein IPK16_30640 [Anaerolineales bacterium]|nr:hypothetical protein [Anaerolineales bacterium]
MRNLSSPAYSRVRHWCCLQPAPTTLSGTLYLSASAENDYDQFVWDDFTLPITLDIASIQWRGHDLILGPYAGPVTDFTVAIYANSIANEPDVVNPPLVEYSTGGIAGETAIGVFGGIAMYDYTFTLPTLFNAAAGTKYRCRSKQFSPPLSWSFAAGSNATDRISRNIIPTEAARCTQRFPAMLLYADDACQQPGLPTSTPPTSGPRHQRPFSPIPPRVVTP